METLHQDCAGLDVHQKTVVACVRHVAGDPDELVESFGTTTGDLLRLGDWLAGQGVTHVAIESTGVYWEPIWNLLEGRFTLLLANAHEVKQVPGRKTDVKDCQWIAQLLQHGLLKASFVPDRPQRELRDLTRQRTQLVRDLARVRNRLQKVLEDANLKLGRVVSDILGVSARQMLRDLIDGQVDPAVLADHAQRRLRAKIPQLTKALQGHVRDHHRFLLRQLLDQAEYLEGQVRAFEQRIAEVLSPFESEAIARLDEIPGIDVRSAQNIVAEIGTDMSRFPTAAHLASWAGLCPGNHRSAGKRLRGTVRPGNRWLRATLTQCAWAAARTRSTYWTALYRRLGARRGGKRATLAVAHAQLTVAYHLLLRKDPYRERGPNYFDRLRPKQSPRRLVRRLEGLGYTVAIKERPAA
ncbi:MAG: IS110 family transposase [Planctomycetes bacterium]|nr:IS110 family transposase [Planctomycetota bacterium]